MFKAVALAVLGLVIYWILSLLNHAEKNAERDDLLSKYNEGQWKK